MSGFNFNEVKERKQLNFVGYDINDNVVVTDVVDGATQNGTPFIQINVMYEGADATKDSTTLKLYMSPKAKDISMQKIMHMHQALNKLDLLKSRQMNTLQEVALALKAMWVGRKMRLKLTGEEYVGVDKEGNPKTKVKLNIPFAPFAESMQAGAEFAIAVDTKLVFDKSNKYDYKPLAAPTTQASGGFAPPAGLNGEAPF